MVMLYTPELLVQNFEKSISAKKYKIAEATRIIVNAVISHFNNSNDTNGSKTSKANKLCIKKKDDMKMKTIFVFFNRALTKAVVEFSCLNNNGVVSELSFTLSFCISALFMIFSRALLSCSSNTSK